MENEEYSQKNPKALTNIDRLLDTMFNSDYSVEKIVELFKKLIYWSSRKHTY